MFYLTSFGVTSIGAFLAWYAFPAYPKEILVGAFLPWLNAAVGFAFMARGLHGTSKQFMVAALGNLGIRLLGMVLLFTLSLVLLSLDEIVFILALFFSYICNSILETIYLQRLKPKTSP